MKAQRVGLLTVSKLHELSAGFPLSQAYLDIEQQDVDRLREWYPDEHIKPELEGSELFLSIHSFVIRAGVRNILIDTCNGNDKERSIPFAHHLKTNYLEQLGALGLTPGDIDIVMCTHLHSDHVGWNTRLQDGSWVPTFPRATYYFSRQDYEFFQTQLDDDFNGPSFKDSVLPVVQAGQAKLVETDHKVERELDHGIWLEGTPGHTPGNCVVHAESHGSRALFSGDVFHHPIQLTRPTLRFFADHDSDQAAHSRRRLLEAHADRDTLFFPGHFPDPTAGRVIAHGDSFRYRFVEE